MFPGFYGTDFEFENEDYELENINERRAETGLPPIGYDEVRWSYNDYHQNVSKKAVGYIESVLNEMGIEIKLKFERLQSPREYNFETDIIIVEAYFDPEPVRSKLFGCPIGKMRGYLNDTFLSRPGFTSFSTEKARLGHWRTTDFDNFHDLGHALEVILRFNPETEYDENDFIEKSTHEVEVGIDNYADLVPNG